MSTDIRGWLFDIYHHEDEITLWILDDQQKVHYFRDHFYPVIYAAGTRTAEEHFIRRLRELQALREEPVRVIKKDFYSNRERAVWQITIQRPSVLRRIHRRLYAFTDKLEIFHSDIEIPVFYLYARGIFPLARVKVSSLPFNKVGHIETEFPNDTPFRETDYQLPDFRTLTMELKYAHRMGLSRTNPLLLRFGSETMELDLSRPQKFLEALNAVLLHWNPDILLSSYGDQILFPTLFNLSHREKIPLMLDRDNIYLYRNTGFRGTSYESYGNILFRAASYPTYGRWHIDSFNSFAYRETQLYGVIELSRTTRLPVQKLSRASTGQALTAMQVWNALQQGYLVPWQKSRIEKPKTAAKLLQVDKGGLVYMPDNRESCVHEHVLELDYSQMYPTIMVRHNISPETVLCDCCENSENAETVPNNGDHICALRRGIVPLTLQPVLERRKLFKEIKANGSPQERERADQRQSALKWMLVTSFGYLGYRNAKFGRLESHEAVTAFGRDILLTGKEIAEDAGLSLVHALTDCLFLKSNPDQFGEKEARALAIKMEEATGVEMSYEGTFSWIVFLNSNTDKKQPTATRYFGRYTSGAVKARGIWMRRKDIPAFFKIFQKQLLAILSLPQSLAELSNQIPEAEALYLENRAKIIERKVSAEDLLFRLTVGKDLASYRVGSPTHLILRQLPSYRIAPGEKVRYLIANRAHKNPRERYLAEETLTEYQRQGKPIPIDIPVYLEHLSTAYLEIVEPLAESGYRISLERRLQKQHYLF